MNMYFNFLNFVDNFLNFIYNFIKFIFYYSNIIDALLPLLEDYLYEPDIDINGFFSGGYIPDLKNGLYYGENTPDPDPGQDGPDPGQDNPDPGQDDPDPSQDDPDPDNNRPDKGKGKARAITPESIAENLENPEESYTDSDEREDFEKARLESLRNLNTGFEPESSKQGASNYLRNLNTGFESFNEAGSSKQDASSITDFERYKQDLFDEFVAAKRSSLEAIRGFNDIIDKLEKEGDFMKPEKKESLLNESILSKEKSEFFKDYAENVAYKLGIDPNTTVDNSDEYSGEESESEYSSEEEPEEEPRPSKRPRN